jgi:hypothetical protein
MDRITLWQWQVKQDNGRWRLLAWRMTEEDAAAWGRQTRRELRKVPGSAEVRQPESRTGGFMTHLGTRK